ncbi:MAG: hypothetical protein KAT65_23915 [Methanophagales archaeon]|nr:hypothetical protein [Methanophagales archaeon]
MEISCSQRSEDDLSLFVSSNPDYYESDRSYNLNISLAPNYSPEEARFELLHDGKSRELIFENHYSFFSADNTAYEAGLPTLHIREVMNSEIRR